MEKAHKGYGHGRWERKHERVQHNAMAYLVTSLYYGSLGCFTSAAATSRMRRRNGHTVFFMLFLGIGAILCQTPCPNIPSFGTYIPDRNVTSIDQDLIEFALNLEFLEAEFFLWSGLGFGLNQVNAELTGGGPSPIGGQLANLDDITRNVSVQFGLQEVGHLRAILATVPGFARPLINISKGVFQSLMDEAFGRQLDPPFNPYQDSLSFLIASYMLPYLGLTGYVGASPILESRTAKRLVAGLLGVEAGQDAAIRAYLWAVKDARTSIGYSVAEVTDKLSELRNWRGLVTGVVDEGVVVNSCLGAEGHIDQNLLSADTFSLAYARTPFSILRIASPFFPLGASGVIATAVAADSKSFSSSSSSSSPSSFPPP